MIARGFKPVGWVAGVGAAALGCYMLSLHVAAERADLAKVERAIVVAKQDIRQLQTELGTRGRLTQLEAWNADVLALSAPVSGQFMENPVMLARFDVQERTMEERARVQFASLDTAPAKPQPALAPGDYEAAARAASEDARRAAEAKPMIRQAAMTVSEAPAFTPIKAAAPAAQPKVDQVRKAGLLDDKLLSDIAAAARDEQKAGGAGGQ